jgi:hypothetical protein
LKHVKENDLAHGEWERWCREEAEISPGQARKMITITEELVGENRSTWNEIGTQALYLIATMPEEARDQPHELPSGAMKKPSDSLRKLTVKELREVKKKLKEAEQRAEAERKERERLEQEEPNSGRSRFQNFVANFRAPGSEGRTNTPPGDYFFFCRCRAMPWLCAALCHAVTLRLPLPCRRVVGERSPIVSALPCTNVCYYLFPYIRFTVVTMFLC